MEIKNFSEFQKLGFLWAFNRFVLHPRGYAAAFVYDDNNEVVGWQLLGDGTQVWKFAEDTDDEGFRRFAQALT